MIAGALVALALAASPASTAARSTTEGLYGAPHLAELPDGRRLALYCRGSGSPTVIFDSGLGMTASAWKQVQPVISNMTRACSYDRAGYGHSDPGPPPRDARHAVDDLRDALNREHIRPPYVLVAHSSGAWNVRLFANLYPHEVTGMVLVEPSIGEQGLRAVSPSFVHALAEEDASAGKCIKATAAGEMKPGNPIYATCGSPPLDSEMARPSLAQTVLSEQESERLSLSEVSASQISYGAKPLIVLTGGTQFSVGSQFPAGASKSELDALQRVWRQGHADIAKLSTNGTDRVVEGAAHVIHLAQPTEVVNAVEDVLRDSRQ